MKQNRINKLTTKLIKTTLALILGMFIAYNLDNEAFATNYSVTYHDNFVSNMPVDESASTLSVSVTLPATTPTRDGFQFKGWCTTFTADGGTCSGTSYAAGGTYTINQVASNNLTLYAVWGDPLYMQDMTFAECTTTPIKVYDKRDGKSYTVAKLADDNCWMLDNLALDPTTVSLNDLKGNTNASDATLGYLKNGGGSSPYTNYAVSDSWTSSGQNYYDRPMINTDSIDVVPSGAPTDGAGSNKVGVYYNYCAASAGSYCYASGSGTGNASEDLCPAGWRMPTGGSSGEYNNLYINGYSSDATNFRNALSTPLSGGFTNGSALYQGDYGLFWSSTRNSGNRIYRLLVGLANVDPTSSYNRNDGYSVRCILGS